MNKKYENIIIDGDVRNIFTAYYSKNSAMNNKDCKLYRFTSEKLPCASGELYAKDTNALYILNKYLAKIIDSKDEYKQIKIYLNSSLFNKISSGKYKYWVETGKTQSGAVLEKKELDEWKIFVQLYRKVFTKINWYQTSLFEVKGNYKFNKEEMNYGREIYCALHKKLIKKAEQDLNKKIFNKM